MKKLQQNKKCLCKCVCVYIYIYIYVYTCIYIYIERERERARQRERESSFAKTDNSVLKKIQKSCCFFSAFQLIYIT